MGFLKIRCPQYGISNCQHPRNRVSQKLDVHFLGYILVLHTNIEDILVVDGDFVVFGARIKHLHYFQNGFTYCEISARRIELWQ